jgi:glycolate oxidase iron-sulfur subunit
LAAQVEDAHAWLLRAGYRADLQGRRVAVHLPCHARRGAREGRAVVDLLRRSGAEVIGLPAELDDACCGMGGSFGARHPDLSRRIGRRKLEAMLAARPEAIVTTCSGCLWQLTDLAASYRSEVPVQHALAWAVRADRRTQPGR